MSDNQDYQPPGEIPPPPMSAPPMAPAPEGPPGAGYGSPQDGPPPKKKSSKTMWIVLIVLLLFCCICSGIAAVIALPQYLASTEKFHEQENLSEMAQEDLMVLAMAVDSYFIDFGEYPPAEEGDTIDLSYYLDPDYLVDPPMLDPWGSLYEYYVWYDEDDDSHHYQLICRGSDGAPDSGSYEVYSGPENLTTCAEDDFLFFDGMFWVEPEYDVQNCN